MVKDQDRSRLRYKSRRTAVLVVKQRRSALESLIEVDHDGPIRFLTAVGWSDIRAVAMRLEVLARLISQDLHPFAEPGDGKYTTMMRIGKQLSDPSQNCIGKGAIIDSGPLRVSFLGIKYLASATCVQQGGFKPFGFGPIDDCLALVCSQDVFDVKTKSSIPGSRGKRNTFGQLLWERRIGFRQAIDESIIRIVVRLAAGGMVVDDKRHACP